MKPHLVAPLLAFLFGTPAADKGRALRLAGWLNGDFDHFGGMPDAEDFMLLDRGFLAQ